MFAEVILASKPTNGAPPIITIQARYPRMIHSELMTHRVFSRNARSSRAVPVKTMLEEVCNSPFVPRYWGKNQKGMQAAEECNEPVDGVSREDAWLKARDHAVRIAEAYMNAGYHKQIANRLLEPFMFIDTLITSTSWANFMHLRDHKDAEPHIRDLAVMIKEAIDGAEYETLKPGQWHLPYVPQWERSDIVEAVTGKTSEQDWDEKDHLALAKISVARCARISYKPFDGDSSIKRELERYDLLIGSDPLHASPAEHQATPDQHKEQNPNDWQRPELAGNLDAGWIQYRKLLKGEYVPD